MRLRDRRDVGGRGVATFTAVLAALFVSTLARAGGPVDAIGVQETAKLDVVVTVKAAAAPTFQVFRLPGQDAFAVELPGADVAPAGFRAPAPGILLEGADLSPATGGRPARIVVRFHGEVDYEAKTSGGTLTVRFVPLGDRAALRAAAAKRADRQGAAARAAAAVASTRKQAEADRAAHQAAMAKLQQQQKVAQARIAELEKKAKQARAQLANLDQRRADEEKRLQGLAGQRSDKEKELQRLEQQRKAADAAKTKAVAAQKKAESAARAAEQAAKVAAEKSQLARVQKERAAAEKALQASQKDLAKSRADVSAAAAELKSTREKTARAQQAVATEQARAEDARKKAAAEANRAAQAEQATARAQARLAELKKNVQAEAQRVQQVRAEVAAEQRRLADARGALAEQKRQVAALHQQRKSAQAQLAQAQAAERQAVEGAQRARQAVSRAQQEERAARQRVASADRAPAPGPRPSSRTHGRAPSGQAQPTGVYGFGGRSIDLNKRNRYRRADGPSAEDGFGGGSEEVGRGELSHITVQRAPGGQSRVGVRVDGGASYNLSRRGKTEVVLTLYDTRAANLDVRRILDARDLGTNILRVLPRVQEGSKNRVELTIELRDAAPVRVAEDEAMLWLQVGSGA
jgi:hypothetical protein